MFLDLIMNDTFKRSQEKFLGNLIDLSIEDLYFNNSMFHSTIIESIVDDLSKGEENVDTHEIRKRLFGEILKNIIFLSQNQFYKGELKIGSMIPLFIIHCFYNKNMFDLVTKAHLIMNDLSQLQFLNQVISNYDFPSKYDDYDLLKEFAQTCMENSQFVYKKQNTGNNISNTSESSVNTLPNSVDKIIDSLMALVENDTSLKMENNEMDDFDKELGYIEEIL